MQNHTAWVQYILVGLVTGFAIQNRTKLAKISKFKLFKEDVGILEHIKNWTCSRAKRMTRKTYSRSPQVNTENTQNINWMCSEGMAWSWGKKKKTPQNYKNMESRNSVSLRWSLRPQFSTGWRNEGCFFPPILIYFIFLAAGTPEQGAPNRDIHR